MSRDEEPKTAAGYEFIRSKALDVADHFSACGRRWFFVAATPDGVESSWVSERAIIRVWAERDLTFVQLTTGDVFRIVASWEEVVGVARGTGA